MHREFASWLKNTSENDPEGAGRIVLTRRGCFRFTGVTKARAGRVSETGISIAIMHKRRCLDALADFEVIVRRARSKGVYCLLCAKDEQPEYIPTIAALYLDHCFKPLCDWMIKNLRPDHYVVGHVSDSGSSTWAEIVAAKDLAALKMMGDYCLMVPVLEPAATGIKADHVSGC